MSETPNSTIPLGGGTATIDRPDVSHDPRPEEPGDHERFSHYVPKAKLAGAVIEGTPVVALCGKVWVPNRSPEKFPICPDCKEIWESFKEPGKS